MFSTRYRISSRKRCLRFFFYHWYFIPDHFYPNLGYYEKATFSTAIFYRRKKEKHICIEPKKKKKKSNRNIIFTSIVHDTG